MNQQEKVFQSVSTKSKEYNMSVDNFQNELWLYNSKYLKLLTYMQKKFQVLLNYINNYIINNIFQQFELVKQNPGQSNGKFSIIDQFLSKVAVYYKTDLKLYIEDQMELINHFQNTLNQSLRKKIILCLLRLRGKKFIEPYRMIVFLMKLFNCQDKGLRRIIFRFITHKIREFMLIFIDIELNYNDFL